MFYYNGNVRMRDRWKVIKNFTDKFNSDNDFKNLCIKISAVFVVFVMVFAIVTGCTQNNKEEEQLITQETSPIDTENDGIKLGNDGINAGIAQDDTEIEIVSEQSNGKMVAMSVEDIGRKDPFLPESERLNSIQSTPTSGSIDLLPPPESLITDETATEVITTKVSGIMYDRYNPSAILNINNSDYLVRTGDIVNGYKILSITKEYVTVQNGANVYKAGVGELLTGEGVNFNTVSNLEKKFGGNKRR